MVVSCILYLEFPNDSLSYNFHTEYFLSGKLHVDYES